MESRAANTFSCGMLRDASDPPPSPSPLLPNTPQNGLRGSVAMARDGMLAHAVLGKLSA